MAFNFSSASAAAPFGAQSLGNASPQASEGPELPEIQTTELGFLPIAGESKLKLLPSWPSNSLPAPTSSLLSVASKKGLLAAAGPDGLVIASTENVRNAFRAAGTATQKSFEPQLTIQVPRIGQLAFSSDEDVLIVSGAESGGLAAYHVDGFTSGKTEPALQIGTNGVSLRALAPNPMPESAELFAAVTTNGELLMANLNSGDLMNGNNGPVLKTGVSCISWSNRGKQLVAGLADGTAFQMTPTGEGKADIPRPPSLAGNMHVSSISWLENDVFLTIYTPSDSDDSRPMPASEFYIVTRQPKTTTFNFQKLPEVCTPFGMKRVPSVQMVARLRAFPPHLLDTLILSSTTSEDINLITKAEKPLSPENVVGTFTLTTMADDSRRAAMPLSEGSPTSPIGMALDLSPREKVDNPILGDPEVLQSDTPLPNIMVLNNEGLLASWWVIYETSIREKTIYSGLSVAGGIQPAKSTPMPDPAPTTSAPAFGTSGFAAKQPFGQPAGSSTFGTPSASSTAGSGGGFGSPNTFGKPSWASTGFNASTTPSSNATSGQPAFGSSSQIGPATPTFGSSGVLGGKSVLGGAAAGKPLFGQAGFGAGNSFGATQITTPTGTVPTATTNSPFSSFANAGGFGAVKPTTDSPFGKPSTANPFGKPSTPSIFGKQPQAPSFGSNMDTSSSFGTPETKPTPSGSLFGAGTDFKLQSGFKGDGSAADDLPRPTEASNGSLFGSGFGDMLGETEKAATPVQSREEEMDEGGYEEPKPPISNDVDNAPAEPSRTEATLVTPPSTIVHSKATPAPPLSNLFGTQTQPNTTPAEVQKSKPWSFANPPSTTPTAPLKSTPFPAQSAQSTTPKVKTEPPSEGNSPGLDAVPEAPLPPDTTSKASFPPGDTSVSSTGSKGSLTDDAPLPPDFTKARSRNDAPLPSDFAKAKIPDDAPLPPDFTKARSGNDAPLPPDFAKAKIPDDAPVPPDFTLEKTKKDALEDSALPDDGSAMSSNFDEEEDDLTQEASGTEGASAAGDRGDEVEGEDEEEEEEEEIEEDEVEEPTSDFKASPESSYSKVDDRSPTGELFTKISMPSQTAPKNRTLFGEIGNSAVFPPPKIQESPRSPSPVRQFPGALLRPDPSRSASAPSRPESAIATRRAELSKGQANLPQPAAQEIQRTQQKKLAASAPKPRIEETSLLEDDEAERLHAELQRPVSPTKNLDSFLYHQETLQGPAKPGISGQIERLYQDINSMIDTLGLNSRAISGFLLYQRTTQQNTTSLPEALRSGTSDNQDRGLADIERLNEGYVTLTEMLQTTKIEDIVGKVQECQNLLSKDLVQLRTKMSSLRKSIHNTTDARSTGRSGLSSEQAAIQHDLRKASTLLQTKLAETEQGLAVLRAKLAEVPQTPSKTINGEFQGLGRAVATRKPTVEAVTATINKMTSMAEQKSADIDMLEAQLQKLNMKGHGLNGSTNGSREASVEPETPHRASKLGKSITLRNPGSVGSVYHTPDSKFSGSTRNTPGEFRSSLRDIVTDKGILVSSEEAARWQEKARRKVEVEALLREALRARRAKGKVTKS